MTLAPSGARIIRYVEIGSTNAEAMQLAARGESGPAWIVAETQTSGKGRSGREWLGLPGNLFASYLFQTGAPITAAHQISLVAGVAVFDSAKALGLQAGSGLRLKWPNDILIGTAKVGGILVESTTVPSTTDLTVVIGIGLNLAAHPQIAERDVTSLAAHAVTASPEQALYCLDTALAKALATWNAGRGFPAIREAWLERCGPLGELLTVHLPQGDLTGSFAGLDADGALLVEIEGGERRRCTYGDVTIA